MLTGTYAENEDVYQFFYCDLFEDKITVHYMDKQYSFSEEEMKPTENEWFVYEKDYTFKNDDIALRVFIDPYYEELGLYGFEYTDNTGGSYYSNFKKNL